MSSQIENIWNNIGTAWDEFEDKPLIEKFWNALASGNQYTYSHVGNVQFSRTIDLMDGSFDYGPEIFYIVYSGTSEEVNVEPVTEGIEQILNGGFESDTVGWDLAYGRNLAVRTNLLSHTDSWSLFLGAQDTQALYTFGGSQVPFSTAEAWFYVDDNGYPMYPGNVGVDIVDVDGNIISTASVDETIVDTWQKVTLYSQAANIRGIVIRNVSAGASVYVDDISLKRTGFFEFHIPEFTYSIPTITYDYKYNGISCTGTYNEGIDYFISSEMNSIIWISTPVKDLRYSTTGVIIGKANHVYRINPVLANVWAAQCGFNVHADAPQYNTFGQETYKHLKMLIWALNYYQNQVPSIYTLKNAYGISSGCPFAYTSGIMNYSLVGDFYNISLGNDIYILPEGVQPAPSGYYTQFAVIASGLELYDYTTNPALIDTYANTYTRRSTLLYQLDPSVSNLPYSQNFRDSYIERIMPTQIRYLTTSPAFTLFAGTADGIFGSTNNGSSWSALNTGLTTTYVQALIVSDTNIFAGTEYGGVFLSTNNGSSWNAVNTGLGNTDIQVLAVSGPNLYAGTAGGGVYLSTNNGTSWSAINVGFTNTDVHTFTIFGPYLFAGTHAGVFRSSDNGANWVGVNSGLTTLNVRAFAISGANIFAGTFGGGVFLSTDAGETWVEVNTGLTNIVINALAVSGTNIFAGSANGMFISTNNGTNWTAINDGLTYKNIRAITIKDTSIFVGTYVYNIGRVFMSTNNGASWVETSTGLTTTLVMALADI